MLQAAKMKVVIFSLLPIEKIGELWYNIYIYKTKVFTGGNICLEMLYIMTEIR